MGTTRRAVWWIGEVLRSTTRLRPGFEVCGEEISGIGEDGTGDIVLVEARELMV